MRQHFRCASRADNSYGLTTSKLLPPALLNHDREGFPQDSNIGL